MALLLLLSLDWIPHCLWYRLLQGFPGQVLPDFGLSPLYSFCKTTVFRTALRAGCLSRVFPVASIWTPVLGALSPLPARGGGVFPISTHTNSTAATCSPVEQNVYPTALYLEKTDLGTCLRDIQSPFMDNGIGLASREPGPNPTRWSLTSPTHTDGLVWCPALSCCKVHCSTSRVSYSLVDSYRTKCLKVSLKACWCVNSIPPTD